MESEIPLVGLRRDELAVGHRLCKGGDDAFGHLTDRLCHRLAIAHGLFVLLRIGCRRLLRRAALSGGHILGRQLVGLFEQGHLIVERRAGRLRLPSHHRLQFLDTLAHLLLFRVFGRCFVEIAQRAVDVLVGHSGRTYRPLRAGTSTVVAGGLLRFGIEQVELLRLRLGFIVLIREQCGEVVHLRTPLFLLFLHLRLLVSGTLVGDDARLHGQGHFGVEADALLRLGLVLVGGREDQPHGACEKQSHKRVHEHLATLLPLLLRERCFRLLLFGRGRRILVLFFLCHNYNT